MSVNLLHPLFEGPSLMAIVNIKLTTCYTVLYQINLFIRLGGFDKTFLSIGTFQ